MQADERISDNWKEGVFWSGAYSSTVVMLMYNRNPGLSFSLKFVKISNWRTLDFFRAEIWCTKT